MPNEQVPVVRQRSFGSSHAVELSKACVRTRFEPVAAADLERTSLHEFRNIPHYDLSMSVTRRTEKMLSLAETRRKNVSVTALIL